MYEILSVNKKIQIDAIVTGYDEIRAKDFYFAGEMHDFWEIVYVDEGHAVATGDERFYKLDAGKIVFHRPLEFHRIWSDEDSEPHVMIISFKAHGAGMKFFEKACFDLTAEEREKYSCIVHNFIKAIEYHSRGDAERFEAVANIASAGLEEFLLSLTEKIEYSRSKLSYNEKLYCDIVKVMKKNCESNLSLEEIAKLCRMSTSNIKRIFNMYSDVGPVKYYQTLRIRRAMELLSAGTEPLNTAKILNYKELSYFYTVFKRETGLTPKQFINREGNYKEIISKY